MGQSPRLLLSAACSSIIAAVLTVGGVGLPQLAFGATRTPILGSKTFDAPESTGYGTYKPHGLYNGGDPAGDIYRIAWSTWGAKTATGEGRVATFKPQGGYYRSPVRVELRASDLGSCTPDGPLAYRRLNERAQSKPGGPVGPWDGAFNVCINPNPETTTPPG